MVPSIHAGLILGTFSKRVWTLCQTGHLAALPPKRIFDQRALCNVGVRLIVCIVGCMITTDAGETSGVVGWFDEQVGGVPIILWDAPVGAMSCMHLRIKLYLKCIQA